MLKQKASAIMLKLVDDYCNAPMRGQYSRLLGKYTTAKKDVLKEGLTNIKMLNELSNGMFDKNVVNFKDEDDVELPKMELNKE
tara:strand:+ start:424 stop:672 length:249 start_codon:yes stop_codon:yes gene_type:complete